MESPNCYNFKHMLMHEPFNGGAISVSDNYLAKEVFAFKNKLIMN